MNTQKYELTDEVREFRGHMLHRIRALMSFGNVQAGELGGFIEKYGNLSQSGTCWVMSGARVYDNALVSGDARICDYASVYGEAVIKDNAKILDWAEVFESAMVLGDAVILDQARVFGHSRVSGRAGIFDRANVYGDAEVTDSAKICDCTRAVGSATIAGFAIFRNNARASGNARIITPKGIVFGHNADIKENSDFIVFKNWWSSGRYFLWTRSDNMWSVGCFYGTGEALINKAYADSKQSGKEYERVVNYVNEILKENKQ